jgi:RNA binding exosome subunit
LILTHAPTEERDEVVKEEFYNSLEKVCDAASNEDMKTILGDFNAKVEKRVLFVRSMWMAQSSQ